jgi:hypothetical protein
MSELLGLTSEILKKKEKEKGEKNG